MKDLMREVPMGLSMALAQNLPALRRFAAMSEGEQDRIIARTHSIRSKEEMRALVDSLI